MGKYTRWHKRKNFSSRVKKWIRRIRYGKIGQNKGVESQRGNIDGFINEQISRKQGGSF